MAARKRFAFIRLLLLLSRGLPPQATLARTVFASEFFQRFKEKS